MDRRPPLAVSPRRLRPRPHRASAGRPPLASSVQTPPGSIKKAQTPMRSSICALPPPSCLEPSPRAKRDFAAAPTPTRAAGKENLHAHDEVALNLAAAAAMANGTAAPTTPLFERGSLYDLEAMNKLRRILARLRRMGCTKQLTHRQSQPIFCSLKASISTWHEGNTLYTTSCPLATDSVHLLFSFCGSSLFHRIVAVMDPTT